MVHMCHNCIKYLYKCLHSVAPLFIHRWVIPWQIMKPLSSWILQIRIFIGQFLSLTHCGQIDGLVQETRNSSAFTMELRLSALTHWDDGIWWYISQSTLAQVIAWWLQEPSHYLNRCWVIIIEVQWQSPEGNFARDTSFNHFYFSYLKNHLSKIPFKSPKGQWVHWLTKIMMKSTDDN